jgi:hypothetical protein
VADVLSPRALARSGVRAWGSATSRWRPPPDFVVIGTKRGGTTTLFRALQDHPQVLPLYPKAQKNLKSPHYFDLNYGRGPRWYRSHFPTEQQRRSHTGPARLVGEASPYYMFHPLGAARLAAELPDARLLVLLRNPVDRAFSHYWDRVKNGYEPAATFEEAIDLEGTRLAGERGRLLSDPAAESYNYEHSSYLARGRYAEQLAEWFAHYPRAQILVQRSEDLYAHPAAVYARTLEFLGLPHHARTGYSKLHGHADRPDVPPATRERLHDYFAAPNAALADLLETDPWW